MMLTGRDEANGGVKSVSGTEELLTCDGRARGRNEILREERGEDKTREGKKRKEKRREGERREEKRREEKRREEKSKVPSLECRYQCSGNLT
jgi:hypothetical protein